MNPPGAAAVTRDGQSAGAHVAELLRQVLGQAVAGQPVDTGTAAALREAGIAAVERGASAGELVEQSLYAAIEAWQDGATAGRDREAAGRRLLERLRDTLPVLVDSSQVARRQLIRQEEIVRQEFIDDLLRGDADVAGLVQRAEPFGLDLSRGHQVVMAQPRGEGTLHRWDESHLERAVVERFGDRDVLVTTKNLNLVALVPPPKPGVEPDGAALQLHQDLLRTGRTRRWRIAAGRPYPGAYGVARSYEEAREALVLGERLQPELSVIRFRDVLIYRVLGRDRVALTDLVNTVLAPLLGARGGAQPLLDTMAAYFAAGGVSAEAARQLQLAVRTVGYRLDKIERLTGYDPADPAHRFTLQAAVLGARLLGWPA